MPTLRPAVLSLLALLAPACEDAWPDGRAPVIEQTRPERARAGQQVTLIGRNFGLRGDGDRVWLGGVEAPVEQWSDRALLVRVPAAAGRGVRDFVVRTGALVSRPFPFEILGGGGG